MRSRSAACHCRLPARLDTDRVELLSRRLRPDSGACRHVLDEARLIGEREADLFVGVRLQQEIVAALYVRAKGLRTRASRSGSAGELRRRTSLTASW